VIQQIIALSNAGSNPAGDANFANKFDFGTTECSPTHTAIVGNPCHCLADAALCVRVPLVAHRLDGHLVSTLATRYEHRKLHSETVYFPQQWRWIMNVYVNATRNSDPFVRVFYGQRS
jgi:hypothetical protein